jgi:hypothetical protein
MDRYHIEEAGFALRVSEALDCCEVFLLDFHSERISEKRRRIALSRGDGVVYHSAERRPGGDQGPLLRHTIGNFWDVPIAFSGSKRNSVRSATTVSSVTPS